MTKIRGRPGWRQTWPGASVETWGWLMVLNAQCIDSTRGMGAGGVGIAGGACRLGGPMTRTGNDWLSFWHSDSRPTLPTVLYLVHAFKPPPTHLLACAWQSSTQPSLVLHAKLSSRQLLQAPASPPLMISSTHPCEVTIAQIGLI